MKRNTTAASKHADAAWQIDPAWKLFREVGMGQMEGGEDEGEGGS